MLFVSSVLPAVKTGEARNQQMEETANPIATENRGDAPKVPAQKPPQAPRKIAKRKRTFAASFVQFGLPIMAVALLIFAVKHVFDTRKVDIRVAPPIQPASAAFNNTVAGNGVIEPQTENIAVGSATPGLVFEVFAKEGDKVHPGTPLLRLDDRQLKAELGIRQANVAAAKAELLRMASEPRPEEVPVQEAMVNEANANLAQMADVWKRTQDLYNKHVSTDQEMTQAQQNYRAAEAKVTHAQAQLKLLKAGAWQYQKDVQQAAVEQAVSQLESIKTDLDRLIVRSQVEGEVLQVNVRPGEFVGAPHVEPLMIIGDVSKLHVRVDVDEHDIPRFAAGKSAVAALKGSPNIKFPITFVKTEPYVIPKRSLTGSNTERVDTRVLQVIYSFDPSNKPVFVGQQVEVFIDADLPDNESAPPAAKPVEST
jgi:HlyD family secretion protein